MLVALCLPHMHDGRRRRQARAAWQATAPCPNRASASVATCVFLKDQAGAGRLLRLPPAGSRHPPIWHRVPHLLHKNKP